MTDEAKVTAQKIRDDAIRDCNKALDEFSKWKNKQLDDLKAEQVRVYTASSSLETREALLIDHENDLDERLREYATDRVHLDTEIDVLEAAKQAFELRKYQEQEALDLRSREITRLELDVLRRNEELKPLEKDLADREDHLRLTEDKMTTQSKKAVALADTYERKLQGLKERENALNLKEVELNDRGFVYSSR